ncbi:hypothetical protein LRC90_004316 [Salmonella enterica]|uniref:ECs1072 family phage-associated protein n=2 Tax=Salmonella enterica TaxID=28901 RepID=UPI0008FEE80B|nr:hypothetical protein [Salmonella enterica]AUM41171.1 hypothetical protein SEEP1673_015230 [Salmonella enterica subsp. enterica serovar Poona str. ATCC BAA-1673]EAA7483509.1 hypothetical protein [Salmonella enterica subsp. enterica serovar Irumu]EBF2451807.1 hypothetical protein [Salmonella enterica subsp. enterica serovar Poona]ECC8855466.1 hypothetical protein [Salmonella enterica subsp. enterica]ECS4144193.1 hypothetical protein [Salmonella enterica subsp. enterica serovar Urbana]EDV0416
MSNYSDLLQMIKTKVCQNNGVTSSSLAGTNNYRANQVWYRIGQIFTLECVLSEYRKCHSSDYHLLDSEKALHHLIFQITKWKLDDIRRLSLNDSLFIISDRLKPDYMPEEAAEFLRSLKLPVSHYPVDDFSESDWDPKENSVFLQNHQ